MRKHPDRELDEALKANALAGLPAIDVAPNQGKLLKLLAQMLGARNILEIGTLGGYSTIWLARALPAGGKIVTLEADPKHAEVARTNLATRRPGRGGRRTRGARARHVADACRASLRPGVHRR